MNDQLTYNNTKQFRKVASLYIIEQAMPGKQNIASNFSELFMTQLVFYHSRTQDTETA